MGSMQAICVTWGSTCGRRRVFQSFEYLGAFGPQERVVSAAEPGADEHDLNLFDLARVEEMLLSEVRTDLASLWGLAQDVTNSYEKLAATVDEGFGEVAPQFE